MKIDTKVFNEAIEILGRVPMRSGIECSEYVKLVATGDSLRLFLSSDMGGEVEVKMDVPETWTFYAERGLFLPFIKQAKGKEIKMEVKADKMVLTDGRRRATYKALGKEVAGYTVINKIVKGEKEVKLTDELRERMALASKYATFDSMSPHLNCVFFAPSGLMTSNSYTIFTTQEALPFAGPFPLELIDLLKEKSRIFIHKKGARLEFSGGWIFCAVRDRCIDGFPVATIEKTLKEKDSLPEIFRASIVDFSETLQRLFSYVQSAAKIDVSLTIRGTKGESFIELICTERQGTFREKLKIKKPLTEDLQEELMLREVLLLLKESTLDCDIILRTKPGSWYFFDVPKMKLQVTTSRKA